MFCSYGQFPGLNTSQKLIDWKENLSMSPAEYYEATHTVLGDGGRPYIDRTGKHTERTLLGKTKGRLPN